MAERRMAEVVGERQRLGQILVEAEAACECAGYLRDLQRVGEPRAVVVALVRDEDLGLVLEAAKSGGVDDAVAVAAEFAPRQAFLLGHKPAARARGIGRIRNSLSFRLNGHAPLPI